MIRQSAFTGEHSMLKGGLHCHTTRSDGRGTPEEVIRLHVDNGYQFLAVTDHRVYNFKNYTDLPITILPGMEMDRGFPPISDRQWSSHCFHTVVLGQTRENGNPYEQDQRFEGGIVKDQYEFQSLLDDMHAHGQITTLCHPDWSCTPVREFENLKGIWAMEIWNSGCAMEGPCDTDNGLYWDEMLKNGHKLYAVATDDGHAMKHHCKGWVMVNSKNNVADILDALQQGKFYSSCGPEIHDFYIDDDGYAHVTCTPVRMISFICGRHTPLGSYDQNGGLISSGSRKVPAFADYLRAVVIDENGRKAWTNPIFLK